MQSDISLGALYPKYKRTWLGRLAINFADRIMGLVKTKRFYQAQNLAGLNAEQFCQQLTSSLGRPLTNVDILLQQVPASGALIIVANHPYGCIEGVALAGALRKVRPDVKVLANKGLAMFKELDELFIYIDPLKPKAPSNLLGIRASKRHLAQGGVLLLFPAGKVSYYRPEKKRICDDEWNRLPATLARACDAPVLPVFIEGHNSKLFINLGRIHYKFKLLMLFRELINTRNQEITIRVGRVLPTKLLARLGSDQALTDYLRLMCYALATKAKTSWPADQVIKFDPLIAAIDAKVLSAEIQALPAAQHLADHKHFSVYYSQQSQTPNVVKEITRLREKVFRLYNEGSGEGCDGDGFDQSYLHLFIFDHQAQEIIGAYRMGQSDKLIGQSGIAGMYLARMFDFTPSFINQQQPCLEMGRSFIVPEHQRSFYGLFLLWRGIGEFVVRHPEYRTLYGTVSLSKLYQPLSVKCITKLALTPCSNVQAKVPFASADDPELDEFLTQHQNIDNILSILVQGIEPDGKDVPILMKQYQKMLARFYCVGIDENFNHTPGLLLSVELPKAPEKALRQYLAQGMESYLDYK